MNKIQPSFIRLKYNSNNKKQTNNSAKTEVQSGISTPSKITADNLRANYLVNFKGGMKYEKSENSGIGTINHQTAFFREPETDEIVQNYILENFNNDDEINIVSGACSTGEEAKSYAMMLDNLKDKLNIYGFDISAEIIEDAKNGDCQLFKAKPNPLGYSANLDSENTLLDDDAHDLSEYQKKCRDKFREYYTPKGPEYSVPVFPNAKQELENFEALLNNPKEVEKQKKQYNDQMQLLVKEHPELAGFMPNISFEDSIKMSKEALKRQVETYNTVRDFSTDMSRFENCSFSQGDVMKLDELYKPNSVNVLLYRNALYHTLCKGDNMVRCMKDDAADTMDVIAKQMNKVVKPQGLVVFGEEEFMQGIDRKIIKKTMQNNGFKLLQGGDADNIWVKVKDTCLSSSGD